jgi:hypothetical protein
MTDQPLQPFSPPSAVFAHFGLSDTLPVGAITEWVLYAAFAFWALYTLVAIYHWLKYSHASWVAFPAIAAHLFVSFALMSYALSGTGFFTAYLP